MDKKEIYVQFYTNEILEIVDISKKITRSDLQGLIQALVIAQYNEAKLLLDKTI